MKVVGHPDWVAHASRVLASASSRPRTFPSISNLHGGRRSNRSLFRRDAETNTPEEFATRNFRCLV
jgi:hypothetical protein